MKPELTRTLVVTKLILLALWPVTAAAATITFGEEIAQTQMLSILMTLILASIMGVTSLLHALVELYKEQDKVNNLWVFVCSKVMGANAAGLFMFFAAESLGVPTNYKAGAIMLAAFGGTWFLGKMTQSFTNKVAP